MVGRSSRRHPDSDSRLSYVDTAKQKGGKKGGKARAAALTPDERSQIAQVAAAKRWQQ